MFILIISSILYSLPYFVVIDHFVDTGIIGTLLFVALYYIKTFYPPLAFPLAIIHLIISVVGIYFAWIDFPIVFAIIYTLYALYVISDFISKIKKGLNGEI